MFVVVCVDGICVSSAKESSHDHDHTCPANPAASATNQMIQFCLNCIAFNNQVLFLKGVTKGWDY